MDEETEKDALIINSTNNVEKTFDEIPAKIIMWRIAKLAIPMAFSFTFTASEIATAMMIVRLDSKNPDVYLAAATLVTSTTNMLPVLAISPLYAMSIIASKKQGKLTVLNNNDDQAKIDSLKNKIADIFKAGVGLSILILPIPMVGLYFSKTLFTEIFRQDAHISELAQENLRAYSYAMPAFMFRLCAEQMMFAFEKNFHAMCIALSSFGIGTGLSLYLAFGSPKLGLSGIAYGYVAESYLTCLGFGIYLARNKVFENIPFFNVRKINRDILQQLKKILRIGLPITLQMACEISSLMIINMFAGWLGEDQLAAQNFSTQLSMFDVIFSISFGQTVSQEVGRLMGKKDYRNAMRVSRYGLLATVGIISVICVPFAVYPEWLIGMLALSVGPRAITFSNILIPAAVTRTIYDTAGYTMTQTLRSADDLYAPTFTKVGFLWAGVALGFFLAFSTSLNVYGLETGFLIGIALIADVLFPRWLNKTTEEHLEKAQQQKKSSWSVKALYEKCTSCFFTLAQRNEQDVLIIPQESSPLLLSKNSDALINYRALI